MKKCVKVAGVQYINSLGQNTELSPKGYNEVLKDMFNDQWDCGCSSNKIVAYGAQIGNSL